MKCDANELVRMIAIATVKSMFIDLCLTSPIFMQESSSFCLKTGMKIKVLCVEDGAERVHYKSCSEQDNGSGSHVMNVITFQIFMAFAGGLAYWGVTVRKKLTMSQFDRRTNPK